MKKLYILLFTILITSLSFGQTSDLYFSMYAEGSSNNKFLEIYNGTGSAVDLGNYSISSCSNGCNVVSEFDYPDNITWAPSTMIADGDVYVIAHGSADASILAQADMTFNYLSNGDDAYALTLAGATASTYTIVDILGDLGGDPGSGWDVAGVTNGTKDHTLTRKTSICDPNATELGSFGTDASNSEWIVTAKNSEWANLGMYTGCVSDPVLTITSPADNQEFAYGTTNVNVSIAVQNFNVANGTGDGHIHWTLDGGGTMMKYDTLDEPITVSDGNSYTVYMELVDNSHTPINPVVNATVNFSVAFPCDLVLGVETAVCDTETNGADTYTATIAFTGGNTSTYTIDTGGVGTVGGDNPSSMATGTISITNIPEGVNLPVTITGDAGDSSCNLSTTIASPLCIGTITCPSVGDIIITEIIQNPSAVLDSNGEWFEVYNTTGSPIDMQGWIIKDDVSASEVHTITASVIVPANGYTVFGINSDSGVNGGVSVDYEYSTISLGNGTDGIILECSTTTIDAVIWDNGATFPDPTGASMELSTAKLNSTDNDNGANWAEAVSAFGDGDLGTPGSANDFALATDDFSLNNFKIYPNPTSLGYVNISSKNGETINATVFDILGKQVINTTVSNNRLDVSNLNTGVYIMRLTQNNATVTKKLVIQ